MIEIRACAGVFARLVAAENALDGGFCHFAARFIRENQVRGHDENAPPRLTGEKNTNPKMGLIQRGRPSAARKPIEWN
jgi:hypothetical protein